MTEVIAGENPITDRPDVLEIDIVSDVVCPWCIIGYKQLEKALQETGVSATIKWHPFELNPQMAAEGENLREHLIAKYGTLPADSIKMRERLTGLGKELGFSFSFSDDMRMVNTFKAHQLLHWAGEVGKAHDLKMALFEAYFSERQDLNDPQVLARIAAAVGLDADEALAVLADGRNADAVRREQAFWTSNGIQGVPAVVFDQKHLVSGAQGVDNFATILRQIRTGEAA